MGRGWPGMSDHARPGARRLRILLFLVAIVAAVGGISYALLAPKPVEAPSIQVTMRPEPAEASTEEVHRLCGACHAYPPPDTFPRSSWRKEVKQGYDF